MSVFILCFFYFLFNLNKDVTTVFNPLQKIEFTSQQLVSELFVEVLTVKIEDVWKYESIRIPILKK